MLIAKNYCRCVQLDASDPKILKSVIKANEIHLNVSDEQHGNWLDCIKSRKEPISPVEKGHRACTVCLATHIAMKTGRKLTWNPDIELFMNDNEAHSGDHIQTRIAEAFEKYKNEK